MNVPKLKRKEKIKQESINVVGIFVHIFHLKAINLQNIGVVLKIKTQVEMISRPMFQKKRFQIHEI